MNSKSLEKDVQLASARMDEVSEIIETLVNRIEELESEVDDLNEEIADLNSQVTDSI